MYERQEIRSVKAAPPIFPPPSDSASSAAAPRPSPVQELDTRAGAAPRRAKSPANIPYSGTGSVGGEAATAGESAANPARLGAMDFPLDPVNRFVSLPALMALEIC
jgi:hypothetical protein